MTQPEFLVVTAAGKFYVVMRQDPVLDELGNAVTDTYSTVAEVKSLVLAEKTRKLYEMEIHT